MKSASDFSVFWRRILYVFRHRKTVQKLVQKTVPKTAQRDSAKDRARNNGNKLQSDQTRPSVENLYQVYLNTDQNSLVDWAIDLKLITKHCPKIMSEKKLLSGFDEPEPDADGTSLNIPHMVSKERRMQ